MIDVTDLPIKETSGISIISGVDIVSVIFPELKFAIINERELSKEDRIRVKSNEPNTPSSAFMDLREGAFVVHEHHGIAIFRNC